MKSFAIALLIIFTIYTIWSNALSSNALSVNDRMESYKACTKLRAKAPNLKLNCENLIQNIQKEQIDHYENNENRIKVFSKDEIVTIKMNKIEEMKLRNLIKNLSQKNKLRKD